MISAAASEGMRLLAQGRLPDAVRAFLQGLERAPEDADCLLGLARARLAQGEWSDVEDALRRLLAVRPGHLEARSHLAVRQARLGDEGAVQRLKEIAASPGAGGIEHQNLADVLLERGDPAGAEAAFARALEADPDDARLRCESGRLALHRGDVDAAMRHLTRATRLAPDDPIPLVLLSRAHEARGEPKRAIDVAREAARRAPRLNVIHEDLFRLAIRSGDPEAAVRKAEELRTLDPTSPGYVLLHGFALLTADRPAEAAGVLEEALRRAPGSPEIRRQLARAREALGDGGTARGLLDEASRAVDADPAGYLLGLLR